jgi:hypothetical protein
MFLTALCHLRRLAVLIIAVAVAPVVLAAADDPETVLITYQVKAGEGKALERVIAEHWRVAQRMRLVLPAPHIVATGGDRDRPFIVELLTWRDGSIPDNAPDAITRLWSQMNERVESRDGHPGIDFVHLRLVTPQSQAASLANLTRCWLVDGRQALSAMPAALTASRP